MIIDRAEDIRRNISFAEREIKDFYSAVTRYFKTPFDSQEELEAIEEMKMSAQTIRDRLELALWYAERNLVETNKLYESKLTGEKND